ncbi:short chain dehydrogenase [Bordetella ansorpii]|uniref:Short chain dehydrogenase n=1 Tax=Bordetella ansorpii TaxID=288768 RepID=A0A157LDX2_9BORD|nr:SDR family NAD(P)-dependent oxidoreductase [Bordetella ansorpii]SAH94479.1 short chain dehydrogenase [Bordetella ansorpii]
MISFQNQTVLVTGGAMGIGLATAHLMARHGARVALLDVDAARLAHAAEALGVHGNEVLTLPADVSSSADCDRAVRQCQARFGGIDHLVHCAGIYPEALVKDTSDADWQRLMHINLNGTFYLCRAVQPALRDGGSVVLLASLAAHRGSHAHAAYAAAKGAILSFSRSLALELAPRVRVNSVSPGIIATSMTRDLLGQKGAQLLASTPLGRHGSAEDIAGAIAFLCSPLAAFVTGETLQVNGGIYLS